MVNRTCTYCGKEFTHFPTYWKGREFCSPEHGEIWREKNPDAPVESYFGSAMDSSGYAGKWKEIKQATGFKE